MMEEMSVQALTEFLQRHRGRAAKTLSILGKHQPFVSALNSEIGFELLKDLIEKYESSFFKIANLEAKDEDKIRFRLTGELILDWSRRIETYLQQIQKINQGG